MGISFVNAPLYAITAKNPILPKKIMTIALLIKVDLLANGLFYSA